MRTTIPHAKMHNFPGYGHGVSVVLPQECARVAADFFDEVDSGAAAR